MAKNNPDPKKLHTSLFWNLITYYYFFLAALAFINLLITLTGTGSILYYSVHFPFIFQFLPALLTYQPFVWAYFAIVKFITIPLAVHEIIFTVLFFAVGYLLLKTSDAGYILGLIVTIATLVFGTTLGLQASPLHYLDTIMQLAHNDAIYGHVLLHMLLVINLIIIVAAPFYLYSTHRFFVKKSHH